MMLENFPSHIWGNSISGGFEEYEEKKTRMSSTGDEPQINFLAAFLAVDNSKSNFGSAAKI